MKEMRPEVEKQIDGLEDLWMHTHGDNLVRVAVLDGPVDLKHTSFKRSNLIALDRFKQPGKIHSFHGTFVTSLIFAQHGDHLKGVAPGCTGLLTTIYGEKPNGELTACTQEDIAEGILLALSNNAHIINISGGEISTDDTDLKPVLQHALENCESQGVLVVAAAGNNGSDVMHVPARYPNVLAVGSFRVGGAPLSFSNWSADKAHGIAIPGEYFYGAMPTSRDKGITMLSGTSFSTAVMSGIAALLASLQTSNGEPVDMLMIRRALLDTAVPCHADDGVDCRRLLAGKLDLKAAMGRVLHGQKPLSISKANPLHHVQCAASNFFPSTQEDYTMISSEDVPAVNTVAPATVAEVAVDNHSDVGSAVNSAGLSAAETGVVSEVPALNVAPQPVCACAPTANVVASSRLSNIPFPTPNEGEQALFSNCQLVFSIGELSYNFGNESNSDTFKASIRSWYKHLDPKLKGLLSDSPYSHQTMAAFLLWNNGEYGMMASRLIWTLTIDAAPLYSFNIDNNPFSSEFYRLLPLYLAYSLGFTSVDVKWIESLGSKKPLEPTNVSDPLGRDDMLARISMGGWVCGNSTLSNHQVIYSVRATADMFNLWTIDDLCTGKNANKHPHSSKSEKSANKHPHSSKSEKSANEHPHSSKSEKSANEHLHQLLRRLYLATRNSGLTADERALNYAVYNIVFLEEILNEQQSQNGQFYSHTITPSSFLRRNSLMRDVRMTFFNPSDTNQAATTYSMTIDLTDTMPVFVGNIEKFSNPVSVVTP